MDTDLWQAFPGDRDEDGNQRDLPNTFSIKLDEQWLYKITMMEIYIEDDTRCRQNKGGGTIVPLPLLAHYTSS